MTTDKKNKEQGFWEDAKENVSEGAKYISDEAKNMGEKLYAYSETIFGKVKDKTSEIVKSGWELTKDATNKAQEVAERFKDKYEVSKLNDEKKKVAAQLGMKYYLAIKNNENHLPRGFRNQKDIQSLFKELEDIDKEILKHDE